jgi:hypothetical protein
MDRGADPLGLDVEDLTQARDPLIRGQLDENVVAVCSGRENLDNQQRLIDYSPTIVAGGSQVTVKSVSKWSRPLVPCGAIPAWISTAHPGNLTATAL